MLRLELARRNRGLTVQELIDLCGVSAIRAFERGEALPSKRQREAIGKALDLDPKRLLDFIDTNAPGKRKGLTRFNNGTGRTPATYQTDTTE